MSVNLCVQLCQHFEAVLEAIAVTRRITNADANLCQRRSPGAPDEESQFRSGAATAAAIMHFHGHKVICFIDSRFELQTPITVASGLSGALMFGRPLRRICQVEIGSL